MQDVPDPAVAPLVRRFAWLAIGADVVVAAGAGALFLLEGGSRAAAAAFVLMAVGGLVATVPLVTSSTARVRLRTAQASFAINLLAAAVSLALLFYSVRRSG